MKIKGLLVLTASLLSASAANAAVSIINTTGGLTPGSGLKIITERGQFQICRYGEYLDGNDDLVFGQSKQIYFGDCINQVGDLGVGLQVDTGAGLKVISAYSGSGSSPEFAAGNQIDATEILNQLSGNPDGPWTNVSYMEAYVDSKSYSYTVTTRYTKPNEYADVEIQVTIPEGVTTPPKVFIASDFFLDGSDFGPGLTADLSGRRMVVQYQGSEFNPSGVGGLYEAAPEEGVITEFGSYIEANYNCTFGNKFPTNSTENCFGSGSEDPMGPGSVLNYPNLVDGDLETDAGVGASWTLPTTAGKYTIKTVLWFSQEFPEPFEQLLGGAANHQCRFFGKCRK